MYPARNPGCAFIDLDEAEHELIMLGDDWADKHAAATLLEETQKTVLSQVTLRYRPDTKSKTDADTQALADAEYVDHIHRMVKARKEANRARIRYEAAKTKIELARTNAANDRALAQMR
jgi:hypothetical protein